MIIAISGTAGSGKSTVAKLLAAKYGYKHYSMGDFQREIANQKGVTITQLGDIEKNDSSIDKMVDEKQRRLGIEEDNFVIDSWLAPLFIPHAYKIFMDAKIEVRAKRIAKKRQAEHYESKTEALAAIKNREKINRQRWLKFYGYDFLNKENYDLYIDTTDLKPEDVIEYILSKIIKKL